MTSLSILPLWPTLKYSHFSRIIILKFRFLDATLEICIQQVPGAAWVSAFFISSCESGSFAQALRAGETSVDIGHLSQHPTEPRAVKFSMFSALLH